VSAEGISVKAMKDGKEVSLVVDSSGQVKELGRSPLASPLPLRSSPPTHDNETRDHGLLTS
jgi:hypothetical protein